MLFYRTFKCTVTGKLHYTKGEMNCEGTNIIYLVTCMKCLEQYVGSATKFSSRFRIHTPDIETKKDRCGTVTFFNDKCCHSSNPFYIYVSSSLRKYIVFMMNVIMKIFYGTEKNIGNPNYLQM